MSRAISVSPLLGPLLVYVLVAPRTLSSMIGGSGMPTWSDGTQMDGETAQTRACGRQHMDPGH